MGLFKRRKETVAVGGEYFGSHPAIKGHYKALHLVMDDSGVEVLSKKQVLHRFTWSEVTGYDNKQSNQREGGQRLTATRMVTLGVFSLAAPKATGKVASKFYCVLHTTSGDIELETEFEGSAGSAMTSLAIETIKKNGHKVRGFIAEHITG